MAKKKAPARKTSKKKRAAKKAPRKVAKKAARNKTTKKKAAKRKTKKKVSKKRSAKKKGAGRPTDYKARYAEEAFKLCLLLAATDAELADFFGVKEQTINNWKKAHPEFFESITSGKEKADADVGQRLYERAMGYSHPEEKIFNNKGDIVRAETIKHYPPDTAAAIFWLKNRQRDKWRDRHEITGEDGTPLAVQIVDPTRANH